MSRERKEMSAEPRRPDADAKASPAATRAAAGEIEIDAPVEAVWKALTDARELERWFPLEARVEPGEGGAIWMSWKNEFEGEQRILKWDPRRHLRTTWEMHEGDQPPQVTDYRLETRGGKTIVRVVTSGFPTDGSWDEWVQGTIDGWAFELRSLKEYLERHRGEDREVVYLRRRVALSPEEIWSRMAAPGALGGRPLGAEAILETPPRQWAAIVGKLDGALLRAGSDPTGPADGGVRDVTLWLSAWGDARKELTAIREEWTTMLERLYPEGRTV
jgi:uncharacterized protein YndB with AHSA1/START domain